MSNCPVPPVISNHFTSPLGSLSPHSPSHHSTSHVVGPGPDSDHRNKSNKAPTSWHNHGGWSTLKITFKDKDALNLGSWCLGKWMLKHRDHRSVLSWVLYLSSDRYLVLCLSADRYLVLYLCLQRSRIHFSSVSERDGSQTNQYFHPLKE